MDRQMLSVAAPVISAEFKLSNSDIAAIANSFLAAYTVGQLFAGAVRGPAGRAQGDDAGSSVVVADGHGDGPGAARERVLLVPVSAGAGGVGELSRGREGGRGVVPAEGTGHGGGDFPERVERGRDDRAGAGGMAHPAVRLEGRVCDCGGARAVVGAVLADVLPAAGEQPARERSGARLCAGGARGRGEAARVGRGRAAAAPPRGVGRGAGAVSGGARRVVLLHLAAAVSEEPSRRLAGGRGHAADGAVPDLRRGQGRGRVAFLEADRARLDARPLAQIRAAGQRR